MSKKKKKKLFVEREESSAEEDARLLKAQEDVEAKAAVRRVLRDRIKELAPQIKDMPPEALTCVEYAIDYVNKGKPSTLIPFPGEPTEISAIDVLNKLGLTSLV